MLGLFLKCLLPKYFLSLLHILVCNPYILCVWFATPASPPAQISIVCTSFCPRGASQKSLVVQGESQWCSSVPLRKAKCHPRALKHHWAHAPHLTQFPNPQTEDSPSISTVTWGQGTWPSLAAWRVFRANTSFSGKKKDLSVKDLSFYMQRRDIYILKYKKSCNIPEYLPPSPKVKLRSNFSQEGDVCQTSTNHYLVFIFTY